MASNAETVTSSTAEVAESAKNKIPDDYVPYDLFLGALKDHNYISLRLDERTYRPPKKRLRDGKITVLKMLIKCSICGYITMDREVYKKHREVHKKIRPGTKYEPCNTCNVDKPPPKGYEQCPYCSFYTRNIASLRTHMHIHNNGAAYKCTLCDFHAMDLKELIQHHNTTKSYNCNECRYSSHTSEKLEKHKEKHIKPEDINTET